MTSRRRTSKATASATSMALRDQRYSKSATTIAAFVLSQRAPKPKDGKKHPVGGV